MVFCQTLIDFLIKNTVHAHLNTAAHDHINRHTSCYETCDDDDWSRIRVQGEGRTPAVLVEYSVVVNTINCTEVSIWAALSKSLLTIVDKITGNIPALYAARSSS